MRRVELSGRVAARPDRLHKGPILGELRDARVVIPVAHKDVAFEIPGDVRGPAEGAAAAGAGPGRRGRGLVGVAALLQEALEVVDRFILGAEHQRKRPSWVDLY